VSALRYCGEIRIRITYLPRGIHANGSYRCFLKTESGASATIIVGAPTYLSHAVDSAKGFDDAARAALAFAVDEPESDTDWSAFAHFDEHGYYVSRSAPSNPYPEG
jgi:hypothetical protein